MQLRTGACLGGRYTLLKVIGQGGTSLVYLAEDRKLQCKRAVKEVRKDFRQDPLLWKREWEMVKRLHHPSLVQMIDVLEEQEFIYFVMEYVEGWTVKEVLEQGKIFSEKQCVRLGKQICQVLHYLHTRNPPVVYRDLKPSNLMLRENGDLVLIDLGTAREYKNNRRGDTVCWGTPGYAAPEQLAGERQTGPGADIYSLGAVLFEMAQGKNFLRQEAETWEEGLGVILERCTRVNPTERYSSCEEILEDLERVDFLGVRNKKRWERKKRWFAVLCMTTGIFFAGSYLLHQQAGELLEKGYGRWMEAGKRSTQKERREESFRMAAQINPWKAEAYEALLQEYRDQGFSQNCYEQMIEFLEGEGAEGVTREYCLRQSGRYGVFAYQMGQACFFEWEGYGNKRYAQAWLSEALQTGELKEEDLKTASCLEKISSYYEELWRETEYGIAAVSYKKFWEDLQELRDLAAPPMERLVKKEVAARIISHADQFYEEGISIAQMKGVLSEIGQEAEKEEFQQVLREGMKVLELMEQE